MVQRLDLNRMSERCSLKRATARGAMFRPRDGTSVALVCRGQWPAHEFEKLEAKLVMEAVWLT